MVEKHFHCTLCFPPVGQVHAAIRAAPDGVPNLQFAPVHLSESEEESEEESEWGLKPVLAGKLKALGKATCNTAREVKA